MPDETEHLTPATDDELAVSLAFALCHDGKRAFRHAEQFISKITAAHLIEHLKRSGYVVMKRPRHGSQHGG